MSNKACIIAACALCLSAPACSSTSGARPVPIAPSSAAESLRSPTLFVTPAQLAAEEATLKTDFYNGTMIVLLGPNVDAGMLERAFATDVPASMGKDRSSDLADGMWLRPDGTLASFVLAGDSAIDIKTQAAQLADDTFRDAAAAGLHANMRPNADLTPPALGAWLPIADAIYRVALTPGWDQVTWETYRLNGISQKDDWYLLSGRVESKVEPAFQYEWRIVSRQERFSVADRQSGIKYGEVYEHEPTTVNTVTKYSWTIGGSLSATLGPTPYGGADFSASYSKSWTTYGVRTLDLSQLTTAGWLDEFDAADNSVQGNFVNYVAAIFQVAKRTQPLDFLFQIGASFRRGNLKPEVRFQGDYFTAYPPEFGINPRAAIEISPGGDAYVDVRAGVFGPQGKLVKRFNFTTAGSTIPNWMKLPVEGANESCSFRIHADTIAKDGDVAFLEFNSSPAFAASSLEKGPFSLLVRVKAGVPKAPPPPPNVCGTTP